MTARGPGPAPGRPGAAAAAFVGSLLQSARTRAFVQVPHLPGAPADLRPRTRHPVGAADTTPGATL